MIPSIADIEALHRRYAPSEEVFELVFTHCGIVAEIALWCANRLSEPVDRDLLQAACMLHDIGTHALFSPDGQVANRQDYKLHALFGAALVAEEGYDPRIADAIRTHVLLGLSKQEIIEHNMALPHHDYFPVTLEGRLLCYADRFHSKHPTFNSYDSFLAGLRQDLPEQAEKLEAWAIEFGIPDLPVLAAKYGHPVR